MPTHPSPQSPVHPANTSSREPLRPASLSSKPPILSLHSLWCSSAGQPLRAAGHHAFHVQHPLPQRPGPGWDLRCPGHAHVHGQWRGCPDLRPGVLHHALCGHPHVHRVLPEPAPPGEPGIGLRPTSEHHRYSPESEALREAKGGRGDLGPVLIPKGLSHWGTPASKPTGWGGIQTSQPSQAGTTLSFCRSLPATTWPRNHHRQRVRSWRPKQSSSSLVWLSQAWLTGITLPSSSAPDENGIPNSPQKAALTLDLDPEKEPEMEPEEPQKPGKPSVFLVFRKIWLTALCLVLVFTVTLSVFPAITAMVTSSTSPGKWSQFFNPICCFLLFNIMDCLGRSLTSYFLWPDEDSRLLPLLVCLRILFVPLFMLCHVPERSRLPILFPQDAYFITFMLLFAVSNGYLVSLTMCLAPRQVLPHEREVAGTLMTFFLALGLSCGASLSFLFKALL
nr:equilibrative nucleoside transporter 2 isoform X4 [Vicugna pacos]